MEFIICKRFYFVTYFSFRHQRRDHHRFQDVSIDHCLDNIFLPYFYIFLHYHTNFYATYLYFLYLFVNFLNFNNGGAGRNRTYGLFTAQMLSRQRPYDLLGTTPYNKSWLMQVRPLITTSNHLSFAKSNQSVKAIPLPHDLM